MKDENCKEPNSGNNIEYKKNTILFILDKEEAVSNDKSNVDADELIEISDEEEKEQEKSINEDIIEEINKLKINEIYARKDEKEKTLTAVSKLSLSIDKESADF